MFDGDSDHAQDIKNEREWRAERAGRRPAPPLRVTFKGNKSPTTPTAERG